MLPAVAGEWFAFPAAPAFSRGHPGEPSHQVQLCGPHIAKRHRIPLELAVDGPVVMRDQALRGDVVLVKAKPGRAHGERPYGLAGWQSPEVGHHDLDHEAPAWPQMPG